MGVGGRGEDERGRGRRGMEVEEREGRTGFRGMRSGIGVRDGEGERGKRRGRRRDGERENEEEI